MINQALPTQSESKPNYSSPYSNILIAVDISEGSSEGLIQAAKKLQADANNIYIFHACEHPITGYGELTGKNHPINETHIRQQAYQPMKQWADSNGIPQKNLILDFGDTAQLLNEHADRLNIDLVIIGSHSTHGFRLFGHSTTDDVINHMICDVLTIKI